MQSQLSALDDQFQAKLLAESERYEELLRDKGALNERWDEQNKQLLQQHEQLLEEVTAECDDKVQVSHVRSAQGVGYSCCAQQTSNLHLNLEVLLQSAP